MEGTITNYLLSEKLKNIISYALSEDKSFVCWSLPNEENIHLIISDEVQKFKNGIQIEELKEGFIFAPFDQEKNSIFYLKSNIYWNSSLSDLELESSENGMNKLFSRGKANFHNTSNEHYLEVVEKSLQEIAAGGMEKVVPGRIKSTYLQENFDAVNFFLNLAKQYSDAFVSFTSIPGEGTWMGASPELLIQVKESIFKTVSLAGTQPYEQSFPIRETSWTQKEIEEQALVSRYIINCFKKIRLREFEEFGPKTIRAGNLLHLKTEFQVDMQATNYPDLGSIMLQLLHPTSAVCGMPAESAKNFLKEYEDFDRSFFAGYLGPVNIDNSTDIFVNLRCLQLIDNYAITYAGAGVTLDSDPVKELNETEIKMHTLIRMLK